MTGRWIEPVIVKIKNILELNLKDKLDAITAEHNDGIMLDMAREIHIGKTEVIQQTPAIMIFPESDNGSRYTNETYYMDVNILISVICFDASPEKLQKILWRYQRAIIEVINETHNLNGEVDICDFNGLRFAGPWEAKGYIGSVAVAYRIIKEQIVPLISRFDTDSNLILYLPNQPITRIELANGILPEISYTGLTNEIILDISGNNNHGFGLKNWQKAGKYYALSFNGINEAVYIPPNTTLNSDGDLTILAWIKPNVDSYDTIITKGEKDDFDLTYDPNGNIIFSHGNGTSSESISLYSVVTNIWQCIGVVRTKSPKNIKGYLNGELKKTSTYSLTVRAWTTYTMIGCGWQGGRYYNGLMGEIRVYNRALSDNEINEYYLNTKDNYS